MIDEEVGDEALGQILKFEGRNEGGECCEYLLLALKEGGFGIVMTFTDAAVKEKWFAPISDLDATRIQNGEASGCDLPLIVVIFDAARGMKSLGTWDLSCT